MSCRFTPEGPGSVVPREVGGHPLLACSTGGVWLAGAAFPGMKSVSAVRMLPGAGYLRRASGLVVGVHWAGAEGGMSPLNSGGARGDVVCPERDPGPFVSARE